MKKSLLLFAAGSIAFSGIAQERHLNSQVQENQVLPASMNKTLSAAEWKAMKSSTAARTSAADRVYDYGELFNSLMVDNWSLSTDFNFPIIWENDQVMGDFTSGADTITTVSVGAILDPSNPDFNSYGYYPGEMKITGSDAFSVTEVQIAGIYEFNPAKSAIVDTIVLSLVKGDASSTSDIFPGGLAGGGHYGARDVLCLIYDSTGFNYARTRTIPQGTESDVVIKIPLVNSGSSPAWGDTSSTGVWSKTITLPTAMSVPANNFVGMSVSFRSGDVVPPYALLFSSTGAINYNFFRPAVRFASDGSGNPEWCPDNPLDSNTGEFKRLPQDANGWRLLYVPHWAWSASGTTSGASVFQHPTMAFKISCPTCGVTEAPSSVGTLANATRVEVYPNPANNELNIPFSYGSAANVNITLTNMLGQVVAAHTFNNVAQGTAVFNTSALPQGIYTYNVNANGARTTGRVVIAH